MIQCTLCLIGNTSEFISQARRVKILEKIDTSLSKYAQEDFSEAKEMLFGENFQITLSDKVEKEATLAKAVAASKCGKQVRERIHRVTAGRITIITTSFFEGALLPGMGANRARASNYTTQKRTKRIATNKGDTSQLHRETLTPYFTNQASHVRINKQISSRNKHPKVAKIKWAAQLAIRHRFGKGNVSSPSGWLFKLVQEESHKTIGSFT